MKVGDIGRLFKDAAKDFMDDSAPRLGASVAFYTIFSLSPLFLILIGILTLWMGESAAARDELVAKMAGVVGPEAAETLRAAVTRPEAKEKSIWATAIATVTLIIGSTGIFMELQNALNRIWEVKAKTGQGVWGFIRNRLLSFAMVLVIGFLLLTALVVTAGLTAVSKHFQGMFGGMDVLWHVLSFVVSFGVITLLFAFMFKFLPDVRMGWRYVWIGAAFTSLLFALGKMGIAWYLGRATTASAFGAAGSLVVLLMWVYYSSQILFFGAELTQVYTRMVGAKVVPSKHAEWLEEHELRKESGGPAQKEAGKVPTKVRAREEIVPPRPQPGFALAGLVALLALFIGRRH